MKCVSYNIQHGKGQDEKIDIDRIGDEIEGANIIALQEVERFWPRSGNVDQVRYFQQRFNNYYSVYGAGIDLHIPGTNPEDNHRRQFGNMLLSKWPIESSRHHLLPKHGSIGPLSLQRSALEATMVINQRPIRFYSIHLSHISATIRLDEMDQLLRIHHSAVHEGHQVDGDLTGMDWQAAIENQIVAAHAVMMGDFNCQPDSAEYLSMAGEISDYGGHISSEAGFVDAWCHCGHDKFQGYTSDVNGEPARLDYAFVSTKLRDKITGCHVDAEAKGSDHRPLWIELNL